MFDTAGFFALVDTLDAHVTHLNYIFLRVVLRWDRVRTRGDAGFLAPILIGVVAFLFIDQRYPVCILNNRPYRACSRTGRVLAMHTHDGEIFHDKPFPHLLRSESKYLFQPWSYREFILLLTRNLTGITSLTPIKVYE